MVKYLLSKLLSPFWQALQWGWNFFSKNAAPRFVLIGAVIALLCVLGFNQCQSKRRTLEQLRVAQGQIQAQRSTIETATTIKTQTYVQQDKKRVQDSLRASALPSDVLEHENDSLLANNRAYLRARTAAGNQ